MSGWGLFCTTYGSPSPPDVPSSKLPPVMSVRTLPISGCIYLCTPPSEGLRYAVTVLYMNECTNELLMNNIGSAHQDALRVVCSAVSAQYRHQLRPTSTLYSNKCYSWNVSGSSSSRHSFNHPQGHIHIIISIWTIYSEIKNRPQAVQVH